MAEKKELVQFAILNNTSCDFNIPLMQRNVYSINATTKYSWNITSSSLLCLTGTIVVNGKSISFSFINASLSAVLAALNALGYGFFCSQTIGPDTFVYCNDDTNVYGLLTLCPVTTSTTTTTTTAPIPVTTSTTTTTTTAPVPVTTSTTTTTTTAPIPVTTSTTTTTTTAPIPVTTSTTTTTTTAAATMVIEIQNSVGSVLSNFTVALNSINVPSLTNISLPTAPNTSGNATNAIVGTNSIIITNNAASAVMNVLISDITDRITGVPLTFTRSGNGTHTITINPITFSAGNKANGIKIIIS